MTDPTSQAPTGRSAVLAFVGLVGVQAFCDRLRELRSGCDCGARAGRAHAQAHAVEFALERVLRGRGEICPQDAQIARLCGLAVALHRELGDAGRDRLQAMIDAAFSGAGTPIALLHLLRTADLQMARGFTLRFAGLADGASFDLLIGRHGVEAEVVCDVISADQGRDVHRGAFMALADRVDPDLQSWLQDHPGRYLLKMTLPGGLRRGEDGGKLAELHARITQLLTCQGRADHDAAAVLRLDPLLLAGAQAAESGLMSGLRQEFGPEAHLAVTGAGGSVFVMAARAAREDEVAASVHRRMAALAPARLTGSRPGLLAMFIEDTDRLEWRRLREQLTLEGEARQFLTRPEAAHVVAVSCASRQELFGLPAPDAADSGELRFRNPLHAQSGLPALAPSVLSTN